MQQSGIFRNEKLHEYRYPASVCYNHGGRKMPEKRKNNCQNPYNVCYDNYLNTNACTECTGLISTPAKDNEEWENYRKIFDFIPDPSDESKEVISSHK